ncbi:MAG: hypothetical protein RI885_959 [Actinomycetota bacterium]|jgi:hypothetical protein
MTTVPEAGSYRVDLDQVRQANGRLRHIGEETGDDTRRWRGVTAGQVGGDRAASIINGFLEGRAVDRQTFADNAIGLADDGDVAMTRYGTTDATSGTGVVAATPPIDGGAPRG